VIDTPTSALPHPRLHLRAFVIVPLAEIAPDCVLPGRGTVAAWLPAVANQGIAKACVMNVVNLPVALANGTSADRVEHFHDLRLVRPPQEPQ
jgi:hypothetical protein